MALPYELLIGLRYTRAQPREGVANRFISFISLISMLGLAAEEHFVGRDILSMAPEDGRALLSTYQNLGYLKGDVMTVLQPKRKLEN